MSKRDERARSERAELVEGALLLFRAGKEEAGRLFPGDQRPETVLGVSDRIAFLDDDESGDYDAAADLRAAFEVAEKVFGTSPSPEAVFGIFDRIFAADEDDDDHDD